MKAAVLGTTGYTGMILLRLLSEHPDVDDILPVSSSKPGTPVAEVDSGLAATIREKCITSGGKLMTVIEAADAGPDVVFAALPHLASAGVCAPFFGKSVVIDLSADFRIKDMRVFEKAYGQKPPRPDLLQQAVYGLCEVYPEAVKTADLIANPGCYPTASLLPLVPLIKAGIVKGKIIINALSGISGAGKKAKEAYLFCERTENTSAYSPGKKHRHSQEIQQEADNAGRDCEILFTPHLVPLKRGMAVTTAVTIGSGVTEDLVEQTLNEAYAGAAFVELRPGTIPQTRDVWGSNRCDISWSIEGSTLFLFSVIDNLMKGASGQAVQNMNLRFGLKETNGLPVHGEL